MQCHVHDEVHNEIRNVLLALGLACLTALHLGGLITFLYFAHLIDLVPETNLLKQDTNLLEKVVSTYCLFVLYVLYKTYKIGVDLLMFQTHFHLLPTNTQARV
jgi:hypothetical protein